MPRVIFLTLASWKEAKWRGLVLKAAAHLETYFTRVIEVVSITLSEHIFSTRYHDSNKLSCPKIDPAKHSVFTGADFKCRAAFFAFSFMTTTMWHDSSWSLNYKSKTRRGDRLIHHRREARQSELAAVSSGALKTREACLKLRCKAGLSAKFSMTQRSVMRIYTEVLFFT